MYCNEPNLVDQVNKVLDKIRPYAQLDGGNIELVNIDETNGKVYIMFQGACNGCPSSSMTLHMGIENELKAAIPIIKEVVAVTNYTF